MEGRRCWWGEGDGQIETCCCEGGREKDVDVRVREMEMDRGIDRERDIGRDGPVADGVLYLEHYTSLWPLTIQKSFTTLV